MQQRDHRVDSLLRPKSDIALSPGSKKLTTTNNKNVAQPPQIQIMQGSIDDIAIVSLASNNQSPVNFMNERL